MTEYYAVMSLNFKWKNGQWNILLENGYAHEIR